MSNAALSKARHLEATRKGWEQKLREDYERENGFLRDLNETLLRDSKILREENERKAAELREKEDQLRDLMVYLEAQAMVASHPGEEMGEGSVSLRGDEDEGAAGPSAGRNATHARLKQKLKQKKSGRPA